jgi:ATP-dependent DNA ligase
LFDCLAVGSRTLVEAPLPARRSALKEIVKQLGRDAHVRITPITLDRGEAEHWLANAHGALDGIVAKRIDQPYLPGMRAMLKVKHRRSADCVVGGFRYAQQDAT